MYRQPPWPSAPLSRSHLAYVASDSLIVKLHLLRLLSRSPGPSSAALPHCQFQSIAPHSSTATQQRSAAPPRQGAGWPRSFALGGM